MIFTKEHHNTQGVVEFEDGKKLYTHLVQNEGGIVVVRIENGWYNEYGTDGEAICSGVIVDHIGVDEVEVKGRNIKRFTPLKEYDKNWRNL